MIKVSNPTSATTIYIPVNTAKSCDGEHILTLHSTLTQDDYFYQIDDEGFLSDFVVATIDLSNLGDGEYEYNLDCASSGIFVIGDGNFGRVEYDGEKTIVQYDAFS